MPRQRKYKITAVFLLIAFSLNTAVGFACSVGIDMGFNSKHHHEEETTEAVDHIHSDDKKHVHIDKKHMHHDDQSHRSDNKKDNCCNDHVFQLEQLDKSVPHSLNIIHPIFLSTMCGAFIDVVLPSTDIVKNIRQFVRSYHPPISDICIAVQSFRI